jgi:UDP-N-acetylmuramoyl-tripeptide--D-alanyl-D-alanine ligase
MTEPLWTAEAIVNATGGRLSGSPFAATGLSIDSRTVEPGDLFVALIAERDGHDFASAALAAGASGILASKPVAGPHVRVDDTYRALWALAAAARDRAPQARRGAVTGSVGKTSITQAVRAGLDLEGDAHGSIKSLNNHLGVPLTLARMPLSTRRAIFEIGMNHAGEIEPLSRLTAPQVVAITNVEAVHIENFPDGEAGVARAKAEIFLGLQPDGQAILNLDNRWIDDLSRAAQDAGARRRGFGRRGDADARLVRFTPTPAGAEVEAVLDGTPLSYGLRQSAAHWGPMSLCAILTMQALGLPVNLALAALAVFEPLIGRGAVKTLPLGGGAFTLIDESYNASPVSVAAAISALAARPAGRKIFVLTDMLELGDSALDRHAELAEPMAAAGLDLVFCAGPLSRALFDALPPARRGGWAKTAEALAPLVVSAVRDGDAVTVKGSNASRAHAVVAALAAMSVARGAVD